MENRTASYTAASVFPAKILVNMELMRKIIEEKKLPIIHVQLNPTNHCNRNCFFCSCSARDKRLELSHEEIIDVMRKARRCGCESVTITGGGEPLMHPRIFDIIRDIRKMGIEIGLVTNGILLDKVPIDVFSRVVWIRISSGDDREFSKKYKKMLEGAIERARNTDWSFSHVLSRHPNYKTIKEVVKFANRNAFSHVRIVSDLLDLEAVKDMEIIRKKLREAGIDDKLVIYQGRKKFEKGQKNCFLSIVKPVIGADGYIYPCCGTQYALEEPTKDYEKSMRMGLAKDIDKLYENQSWFDGSVCDRCYYKKYNDAFEILLSDVRNVKFL